MIRTQDYLTEEQARGIQARAARDRKPAAAVIRDLLDKGRRAAAGPRETTGEALLRLAAIRGRGPADLSERIDDYLYGDDI